MMKEASKVGAALNCRKGKLTLSLVASLMRLTSTYQNTVLVVFSVFLTEKEFQYLLLLS